jgi:rhamnulose-1-phosphate aldolase
MALEAPFPELDELLAAIGEAGRRVSDNDASEGAAGNISVYIGWQCEVRRRFPIAAPLELPVPVAALKNKLIIVTGSGRRLRDIQADPAANLAAITINADGRTAEMHTSPSRLFAQVTK